MTDQHHHSWDEDRSRQISSFERSATSEIKREVHFATCTFCNLHRRIEVTTVTTVSEKMLASDSDRRAWASRLDADPTLPEEMSDASR